MASSTAPRSVVIKVNGRLVLETKRQSSPTKGVDPEVMFMIACYSLFVAQCSHCGHVRARVDSQRPMRVTVLKNVRTRLT